VARLLASARNRRQAPPEVRLAPDSPPALLQENRLSELGEGGPVHAALPPLQEPCYKEETPAPIGCSSVPASARDSAAPANPPQGDTAPSAEQQERIRRLVAEIMERVTREVLAGNGPVSS
jgi:hypothetical protein